MNIFSWIFQELLFRPLFNLLVIFYQLPLIDFGGAILLLTILIRAALFPLTSKATKRQIEMQVKTQEFQEKLKQIQKEFANDPLRQKEEIMKLWREKKINPFSNFVPFIIQIIILIALYQVFRFGLQAENLSLLYSFVPNPGKISPTFLKIIDLSKPLPILAGLTAIFQFLYSRKIAKVSEKLAKKFNKKRKKDKKTQKMEKMQKTIQNQMSYFMSIFIFLIGLKIQSALVLYWLFATLIGILEQKLIERKLLQEKKSSSV